MLKFYKVMSVCRYLIPSSSSFFLPEVELVSLCECVCVLDRDERIISSIILIYKSSLCVGQRLRSALVLFLRISGCISKCWVHSLAGYLKAISDTMWQQCVFVHACVCVYACTCVCECVCVTCSSASSRQTKRACHCVWNVLKAEKKNPFHCFCVLNN